MPARSVCLVTLSLSEAGPGRFGRQVSVTDIYQAIPSSFGICFLFSRCYLCRACLAWKPPLFFFEKVYIVVS